MLKEELCPLSGNGSIFVDFRILCLCWWRVRLCHDLTVNEGKGRIKEKGIKRTGIEEMGMGAGEKVTLKLMIEIKIINKNEWVLLKKTPWHRMSRRALRMQTRK